MKISISRFNILLICMQLFLILLLACLAMIRDYHLSELAATGRVIRYTGDVIMDTQVLVKLELNRAAEDRAEVELLRKNISLLMNDLSRQSGLVRAINDQCYQEELSRLYMHWRKLESMIDICRKSPENNIHLFMLSIEFYHQSKTTLATAEKYSMQVAEKMRKEKIIGGILLGIITVIAFLLFYIQIRKKEISE